LLAISLGDNAPSFNDFSRAIPLDVGLPSGDTQGIAITDSLLEFL